MNYGSKLQRSLYFSAPHALKNLLARIYGENQKRLRYGSFFHQAISELKESQSWSYGQLRDLQESRVQDFVNDAVLETAFYREDPAYDRMRRTAAISDAPILSKQVVRDHQEKLCRDNLGPLSVRWAHTSGTTGKSLHFPLSQYCFQREYAFREVHYSWAGVSLISGEPIAACQGHPVAHYDRKTPPFWVEDSANKLLILSSYHMSPRNFASYAAALDAWQPVMINGYPSSVYLLALAYQQHGKGKVRPKGVFTTSETLFDYQREVIEETFGCKVFDWYGNSEMCGNIVQCEEGIRHLKMEHSLIEVLNDDDEPAGGGETGRLICTGFGNHAFPLVRYDIGDRVTLATERECACGRGGLLVSSIAGRVEDYVITADGRYVGRLDHLFKDSQNVVEAQVVQTVAGKVSLRVVRTAGYGPRDEKLIREEAALRLGSDTEVEFEYCESIPRGANGKFPFVVTKGRQAGAPIPSSRAAIG